MGPATVQEWQDLNWNKEKPREDLGFLNELSVLRT